MTIIPEMRGYIDSQGKQSIYIRVTQNGKRSYRKSGIKVKPAQWNGSEVIGHPNQKLYNRTITKLLYEAEATSLSPAKLHTKNFTTYYEECASLQGTV